MSIKIFQIGFNKCGTLSIHNFFTENNISSAHYLKGELAKKIFFNHKNDLDLLSGLDDYDAFSDMEYLSCNSFQYVALDLFKELHKAYPNAIFILNTRNVEDWVQSRLKHGGGTYLDRYRCILDLPQIAIIDFWITQYQSHIENVKNYFSKYPSSNFIHLDLDKCNPEELGRFLTKKGIKLTKLSLPHAHKSSNKGVSRKKKNLWRLLDAAWYFKQIDTELSETLFEKALKIDPTNIYANKMLVEIRPTLIFRTIKKIKTIFGDRL